MIIDDDNNDGNLYCVVLFQMIPFVLQFCPVVRRESLKVALGSEWTSESLNLVWFAEDWRGLVWSRWDEDSCLDFFCHQKLEESPSLSSRLLYVPSYKI